MASQGVLLQPRSKEKTTPMMERNLREMEQHREVYWLRYPATSPLRLRWRAIAVRHCFHVLPGESILEIGAGSGLWTEHLTRGVGNERPIAGGVCNGDLDEAAGRKKLGNGVCVPVSNIE